MNRIKNIKKIKEISKKIENEYQPEEIILFGSYAWGNPSVDSDADLLVVKDGEKNSLEMMREVRKIVLGSGMALDILVYTSQQVEKRKRMKDPFIRNIFNSGKVLYEK